MSAAPMNFGTDATRAGPLHSFPPVTYRQTSRSIAVVVVKETVR